MTESHVNSAVGGTLARIASALERLTVEPTADALLGATAREATQLLDGVSAVVSRRDGETVREVTAADPNGPRTSPFAEFAYHLDDYPLTRKVLETGRPEALSLDDPAVEPTEAFVLREMGMRSVIMLALPCGDAVWGIIEVYREGGESFDTDETALGEFFARQVGGLLVHMEDRTALQRVYRETLASLANALEEKDSYTHDHTQEVVNLTVDVARRLGLGPEELDLVELGALFHDIGKIRVPESILNKPGKLDEDEWAIMRRHTIAGETILAPITSLKDVLPIVRSSHERWDGAGYPDGLAGKSIPIGARIVSVCDAFRAMTERRPYREPMSERDATLELRLNAGTQFDPVCVRALVSVLTERDREDEVPLHRPAHAA
jgi:putative nucleotidyltransferase with HDIG domain